MPHDIKMPPLSQTTDEVRLVKWLVKVGDRVRKGDPLCEVENDKSVMPLESVAEGDVLQLCTGENVSVAAGTVIAVLGKKGEAAAGGGIVISRIARQVAEKKGIDLSKVRGTGPGGRIVLKDLEIAGQHSVQRATAPAAAAIRSAPVQPALTPYSPLQAAIARNLVRSKTEIPHFYATTEIEVSGLLSWIAKASTASDSKPSFYAPLVFAAARALAKFPRFNSSARPDGFIALPDINIGIAVAVGEDIYVPVIKHADTMGLQELNRSVRWLIAKAQNRKLERDDQTAGTITISNLGMYPIDDFCAIINPPQAAILAIGRKKKVLHVGDDNSVSIREIIRVTASFDHRIVNGALAGEFLAFFKRVIEQELI